MDRREFLTLGGKAALAGVAASHGLVSYASSHSKGGQLVLAVTGSSTDQLNPATWAGHAMPSFGKTWGETLIEPSIVDKSPIPVLAESWQSDDSSTIWNIKLRQGVLFHNGQTMTSDDVVKTLKRHTDKDSQSAALGSLADIKDVSAAGKYEIIVELKRGNINLPLLLSDYHLIIQPGGGVDNPNAGIGTGPYRVSEVETGIKYASKRFKDSWRPNVGFVDSVEILIINDNTARVSALRSGRVHMINQVDPKTARLIDNLPNISVRDATGGGHYTFSMMVDKPPFDNPDVRLALKTAIDREQILERILQGYGSVGNDFPVNASYPLAPTDIEQRAYDPELARKIYKRSGNKKPIVLHVSDVAFSGAVDMAVLFQASAAKAGIEVNIKKEPSDGYWSDVWNKVSFSASYWSSRSVQDQIYSVAYKGGAPWNETRWNNAQFNKWIDQAKVEANVERRRAILRNMGSMLHNQGGVIIPVFNNYIDAISDKVRGYQDDSSGPLSNYFAPIRVSLS